jgi:uncharacterized protein (DUF2062 family)
MDRQRLREMRRGLHDLQQRWYMQPLRGLLLDARLWSLQRRSITLAFGCGLALCFLPLPVQVPFAVVLAIIARLNIPVIVATTLLVNPLTVVPVYYVAYRIGAAVLGVPPGEFSFELSWDWLQHGLGPLWRPFLVGCAICGTTAGLTGWGLLEYVWRRRVRQKYRDRRGPSIPQDDGFA